MVVFKVDLWMRTESGRGSKKFCMYERGDFVLAVALVLLRFVAKSKLISLMKERPWNLKRRFSQCRCMEEEDGERITCISFAACCALFYFKSAAWGILGNFTRFL